VWHDGLLFKLKHFPPAPYYLILKSYLENRSFSVRINNSISISHLIEAGVPQGSDLSPLLYNVYTSDIPSTNNTILATYADDLAILASSSDANVASEYIQSHLNLITTWAINWRVKINETKSVQVNFTLRRNEIPSLILNGTCIQIQSSTKYLGITLDKRLTWSHHTKSKRKQANIQLHLLCPILKFKISLANKMFIYKSLIRPVWSYGI
jgi:hypothetical protein